MKAYRGVEVLLHTFLALGLDGDEWSASLSDRFAPRERAHGTHFIGGWVGPRAILDMVAKWKNPRLYWKSNPSGSNRSLITILTELPRLECILALVL
jgi:hypothetical protein